MHLARHSRNRHRPRSEYGSVMDRGWRDPIELLSRYRVYLLIVSCALEYSIQLRMRSATTAAYLFLSPAILAISLSLYE